MLDQAGLTLIDHALATNVVQLFELGISHFDFACGPADQYWRQRTSRLYYAAYAVVRAVRLEFEGSYSTDVTDHAKMGDLPSTFPHRERYKNQLGSLREDRNLADYDHSADETELLIQPDDAEQRVIDLIGDARAFLRDRGVNV